MEYRKLPHGSERLSVIGLGTSVVGEHSVQNVVETVTFALDSGVNYIDLAGGHAAIFPGIGEALAGRRKDAYVQLHFGADYTSGEYGWNPTLDGVKKSVAWQLEQLKTDYIDFGFMHCHPCPAGLDIGLINKYYDLSRLGDVLAKEHYLTLEKTASDCLQCGHCNSRCPFSVDQMARMEEIQKYFGR